MLQVQGSDLSALIDLVKDSGEDERPAVIYVSGLFSESKGNSLSTVVELGDNLKRLYATDFVVANPTAPWVVASSEEEGYAEYQKYLAKLKALRNAKIAYSVGDPITAANKIFLE